MTRRADPPGPMGFLVVDKPVGWTSHDVVNAARRWFGVRRIGHLGTLDPLATGVLPLAVREATKLLPYIESAEKVYVGAIQLGVATDTYDAEGRVTHRFDGPLPTAAAVAAALAGFVGERLQVPPMYSSVKKHGVPLYKLARRGEEVEREPRRISIFDIKMPHYRPPEVGIEVRCSAGTYVRSLAHELGEQLGCGAHLASLRREQSGPFQLAQARTPQQFEATAEAREIEALLIPPAQVLGLPRVALSATQARRVANGGAVPVAEARGELERGPVPRPGDRFSGMTPGGALLAVLELQPDRRLQPLRVLGRL